MKKLNKLPITIGITAVFILFSAGFVPVNGQNTDKNRSIPEIGFDGYPKRDYVYLFSTYAENMFLSTPHQIKFFPLPGNTINSSRTIESTASTLIRLSNWPMNLLYDKIGTLWASLIMVPKIVLIDYAISHTAMVLNHEYSGHGIKFMEGGSINDRIKIEAPFPYGNGGGVTYGYLPRGVDDNLMVMSAGSDANSVLAHEKAILWISDGVIHPYEFLLYGEARLDQFEYVLRYTDRPRGMSLLNRGDFEQYINILNNKYGRYFPQTFVLTDRDLKRWAYIALADPLLYISLGTQMYSLVTGKQYMEIPMMDMGEKLSAMPSSRIAFTPNGPEAYGDIFFRFNGTSVLHGYFRYGNRSFRDFWGFGARLYRQRVSKFVTLGGGFDFYRQPEVTKLVSINYLETVALNNINSLDFASTYRSIIDFNYLIGFQSWRRKQKNGIAGYVDLTVTPILPLRIHARIGYKTEGYVFGLSLREGFLGDFGFGFFF